MAQYFPFLPLVGGGNTRFQPVYVGDVAAAVVKALDDPATQGRTYELGGPTGLHVPRADGAPPRGDRAQVPAHADLLDLAASSRRASSNCLLNPMLTRDQVELLKRDNVVSEGAQGLPGTRH